MYTGKTLWILSLPELCSRILYQNKNKKATEVHSTHTWEIHFYLPVSDVHFRAGIMSLTLRCHRETMAQLYKSSDSYYYATFYYFWFRQGFSVGRNGPKILCSWGWPWTPNPLAPPPKIWGCMLHTGYGMERTWIPTKLINKIYFSSKK